MEIITHDSRSHLFWGLFLHSETNKPFYAMSALYDPFPQLLVSKKAAASEDWSSVVASPSEIRTGIYRHFKGGLYQVFGEFMRPSTREWHVAYVALYGQHSMMVRPTRMFQEYVVKHEHAYEGPRFLFVRPC
jgi:hypothetical protein